MTYRRQNRLQKELLSVVRLFKTDKEAIQRLKNKGIGVYTPKIKRWKLGLSVSLFGLFAITPFTPEVLIIPKLTRWCLQ